LAYCQADGMALYIQQSPAEGGKVTPQVGIHHFKQDQQVSLTAEPAAGYQFVYWLGDVSSPAESTTATVLDSPKIIIAVFEKVDFDFLPAVNQPQGAPIGGLYNSEADYSQGGISPVSGRRPHKFYPPTQPKEPEEEPDFPIPEENNFPVPQPIPEPATVCLLGLGAIILRRVVRKKG